jgi:drug/metabolite transporter (DMT)-like permease
MGFAEYARGALYGLAAISIWAGWMVVARAGLRASLTPWDIAALRFAVAGVILVPYLLRSGLAIERLGWSGLMTIVLGGGAPMVLLANTGLLFAPAAHAGALFAGVVPLFVALLAAPVLGEPFSVKKGIGLVLIACGVGAIVWGAAGTIGKSQNIGHALFLCAALAWALYTIAMRRARLDGLHAAAIAAIGALLFYLPVYVLTVGTGLFLRASLMDLAIQAFVQGLLTAIISAALYGRAVGILGASSGSAFSALCPRLRRSWLSRSSASGQP